MYVSGISPPGLEVFIMKATAPCFQPKGVQFMPPPGVPIPQSQGQNYIGPMSDEHFINREYSFENDTYGSEYSQETSESQYSPGPFATAADSFTNDPEIEKRNKLKNELLHQITKNDDKTPDNAGKVQTIKEQVLLQMTQKLNVSRFMENSTSVVSELERAIITTPPGISKAWQNNKEELQESPFQFKKNTKQVEDASVLKKSKAITPPPGIFTLDTVRVPKFQQGYYSKAILLNIEEAMNENGTIQKLPPSADYDVIHRSNLDGLYSSEQASDGITYNRNTPYKLIIDQRKKIRMSDLLIRKRKQSKEERELLDEVITERKADEESIPSDNCERKNVDSEENWCETEEIQEPISVYDYDAEFYPTQQYQQLSQNGNENFEQPGPSSNMLMDTYKEQATSQNYDTQPKVKKNRFTENPRPHVQQSGPPSNFNPSSFLAKDDRAKNFRIWNHFCRGRPLTMEGRRNTPLEGMEFAEIMDIFKKMVIERAVVAPQTTKKASMDSEKPTTSAAQNRGERQLEEKRPPAREYVDNRNDRREESRQDNYHKDDVRMQANADPRNYNDRQCEQQHDYRTANSDHRNYDERQNQQQPEYRTESPYDRGQSRNRTYNNDWEQNNHRQSEHGRQTDSRQRNHNYYDEQECEYRRTESPYTNNRNRNASNQEYAAAYRSESPYYQQQHRNANSPRRVDNYEFGRCLYNNYLNRNNNR